MSKRALMSTFPTTHQPDEGYSEDPLTSPNDVVTTLASLRSLADLPSWLASNASALPLSVKTGKSILIARLSIAPQ
jgi:hypothetical protein